MKAHPDKPLVIYDGECGICAGNLKWLYRLDMLKRFDATPYQESDLLRMFPHLKLEECQQALHLVFPDTRTYTGADAFRQVFLRMPLMFPIGLLLSIPPLPWLLRKLYPILSRNRYRIGGRCEMPVSKPQDRQGAVHSK